MSLCRMWYLVCKPEPILRVGEQSEYSRGILGEESGNTRGSLLKRWKDFSFMKIVHFLKTLIFIP